MVDSAERLINLALFLAGSSEPVTAEACRENVVGYPEHQDDDAFARMFERDKELLRGAGLPIEVVHEGETEAYRLIADAYAAPIALTAEERATLAAAGAAMSSDPSFPLADDLRFALAKLGARTESPAVAGTLADESPEAQGETAAALTAAVTARKQVAFGYTNVAGRGGTREVEPYGLFLREGRWYLVGRDVARDEVRTYAVARVVDLEVNAKRPKSPDFERPSGFDVAASVLLPFQYGPATRVRTVRFARASAWRAARLTAGQGELEARTNGDVMWRVRVADDDRFLRWIVENGPDVVPVDADLRQRLAEGLRRVVAMHGAS